MALAAAVALAVAMAMAMASVTTVVATALPLAHRTHRMDSKQQGAQPGVLASCSHWKVRAWSGHRMLT